MGKKRKQKGFKEENLSDNNKKEDEEMVKYRRVRSHYKKICIRGRPCKRVYVKAHLRKIKKRR